MLRLSTLALGLTAAAAQGPTWYGLARTLDKTPPAIPRQHRPLPGVQPRPARPNPSPAQAPDDVIRGRVDLFVMDGNTGRPIRAAATVQTQDAEIPKVDTLHCSYATQLCFFLTFVRVARAAHRRPVGPAAPSATARIGRRFGPTRN